MRSPLALLAFVCSLVAACGAAGPTGGLAAATIAPATSPTGVPTLAAAPPPTSVPTSAPTARPTTPPATQAPAPTNAPAATLSRPTTPPTAASRATPASGATASSPAGTPTGDIDFVVITLERGPCFGACPVYKVTIRGTGEVTWEGRRFVKVMGPASAKIDPNAVRGLLDELVQGGYFDMRDTYTRANATDMPSAVTSVTLSGRAKSVNHYYGDNSAPKILTNLEKRIDEVAGTAQWIK